MIDTKRTDTANIVLQLGVALGLMLGIGYCLYTLTHVELKTPNNSAFLLILGALIGSWGSLQQFCFPANVGTLKQNDTINQLAQKASPATVPLEDTTVGQLAASSSVGGTGARPSDTGGAVAGGVGGGDGDRGIGAGAGSAATGSGSGSSPLPIPSDAHTFPDSPPAV